MCVIGYDDDMYGGAFEIQNSWGTGWGNDGYIWISYGTFAAFVNQAYEISEDSRREFCAALIRADVLR
jgi:C1A family cysteine protease